MSAFFLNWEKLNIKLNQDIVDDLSFELTNFNKNIEALLSGDLIIDDLNYFLTKNNITKIYEIKELSTNDDLKKIQDKLLLQAKSNMLLLFKNKLDLSQLSDENKSSFLKILISDIKIDVNLFDYLEKMESLAATEEQFKNIYLKIKNMYGKVELLDDQYLVKIINLINKRYKGEEFVHLLTNLIENNNEFKLTNPQYIINELFNILNNQGIRKYDQLNFLINVMNKNSSNSLAEDVFKGFIVDKFDLKEKMFEADKFFEKFKSIKNTNEYNVELFNSAENNQNKETFLKLIYMFDKDINENIKNKMEEAIKDEKREQRKNQKKLNELNELMEKIGLVSVNGKKIADFLTNDKIRDPDAILLNKCILEIERHKYFTSKIEPLVEALKEKYSNVDLDFEKILKYWNENWSDKKLNKLFEELKGIDRLILMNKKNIDNLALFEMKKNVAEKVSKLDINIIEKHLDKLPVLEKYNKTYIEKKRIFIEQNILSSNILKIKEINSSNLFSSVILNQDLEKKVYVSLLDIMSNDSHNITVDYLKKKRLKNVLLNNNVIFKILELNRLMESLNLTELPVLEKETFENQNIEKMYRLNEEISKLNEQDLVIEEENLLKFIKIINKFHIDVEDGDINCFVDMLIKELAKINDNNFYEKIIEQKDEFDKIMVLISKKDSFINANKKIEEYVQVFSGGIKTREDEIKNAILYLYLNTSFSFETKKVFDNLNMDMVKTIIDFEKAELYKNKSKKLYFEKEKFSDPEMWQNKDFIIAIARCIDKNIIVQNDLLLAPIEVKKFFKTVVEKNKSCYNEIRKEILNIELADDNSNQTYKQKKKI